MKFIKKYWLISLSVFVVLVVTWAIYHFTKDAVSMAVSNRRAEDSMQNLAAAAGVIISFSTAIFLLITIMVTGLMLRETQNAVKEAQRLNAMTEANERPILGVRFPNPLVVRTDKRLFATENKFVVVNLGRTAAKITSIYREWWGTSKDEEHPPALTQDTSSKCFEKSWSRHVGGGSETEAIWTGGNGFKQIFQDGRFHERVFFRGRIRYEDMDGGEHECLFTYFVDVTDNERHFAMSWPSKQHEKYNYCRPISEPLKFS